MYQINLQYHSGFSWYSGNDIHVIGYAFYQGHFMLSKDIAECLSDTADLSKLKEKISNLNGVFSIIITNKNNCYLYSDKSRFFTLFYHVGESIVTISDTPETIVENNKLKSVNTLCCNELLGCGFVLGAETLIEGLKQVEGSQWIVFEKNQIFLQEELFNYSISKDQILPQNNLYSITKEAIGKAFGRFVLSLQGRTAIVPLSGGYDSRMIVAYLHSINYPNVICFTYGIRNNPEVKISKEIAGKAGYPWFFIEYTDELIQNFFETKQFHDYWPYVSRYSSNFYMQEYYAAQELHRRNLVPEDAIFVPGHSGDLVGGSQLAKIIPVNIKFNKLAKDIYLKKFNLNPIRHSKEIIKCIQIKLNQPNLFHNKLGYSIYEDWDIKEKIAKFNINSSRVFTFFGYEVRFPYWDDELMNHFATVPLPNKIGKNLYNKVLINEFFKPFGLISNKELEPSNRTLKWQSCKNQIKKYIPRWIFRLKFHQHDNFRYQYFTGVMVKDALKSGLRLKTKGIYHNAIISQWYIHKVKSNLNVK